MMTLVKLVQKANELLPMLVTLPGMIRFLSLEQDSNALPVLVPVPMVMPPLPIVMFVKLPHA